MFWRKVRRRQAEQDVRDELQLHRELRAADPASPAAKSTASETELIRLAKSRDRRLSAATVAHEFWFDVVDAVRRLRRAPGFTLGTMGILALGLGANTAVFTVANTIYFRALPFASADRLLRVYDTGANPDGSVRWVSSNPLVFENLRRSPLFSAVSVLESTSAALRTASDSALHVGAGEVDGDWGGAIGIATIAGRHFTADEVATGARVAMISHHLWQTHFGGRADVIGQTLDMDGGGRTVVGVMPPGYRFPYQEDLWWPRRPGPNRRALVIYARMSDDVTLARVNQELSALGSTLNKEQPLIMRGLTPRGRPIREVIVDRDDRVVVLLTWSVAVLLLIVASNAAMLLTTRVVSREREWAVRAALGCGRARQVRHLVIETVSIFFGGAAAGIAATMLLRRSMVALLPERLVLQLPMASLPVDGRVVAFTLGIATLTGVVFGLLMAWRTSSPNLASVASASSRAIGSVSGRRTLSALVVVELTFAASLLGASAVLTGAIRQMESRDVGFDTRGLTTLQFELAGSLTSGDTRIGIVNRLEEELAALPGVSSVGSTTVNPLCCGNFGARATPEGQFTRIEDAITVHWRLASPALFKTLGVRTLAGRTFEASDRVGSEPVVVVDDRLVRRFWPGQPAQDAIGRRVKQGGTASATPWLRIVGVVSAVEDQGDYTETWYLPYFQNPTGFSSTGLHVFVRTSDPDGIANSMRAVVREVNPNLAIINLRGMEAVKMEALAQERIGVGVAALFAGAGVLLSLSGVYGLVAFIVAGQRREMAIRIALGAPPAVVMRGVIMRIARMAIVGAAIGAAVALAAQPRLLAAVGAQPDSVWQKLVAMTSLLLIAAAVAAWLPARRVLKLDPRDALSQ